MARGALGWSIPEAATAAGVGTNTVARFEKGSETYASTVRAIRSAYEAAGITFLAGGEASLSGGEGVRFDQPKGGA